jgi:integrase
MATRKVKGSWWVDFRWKNVRHRKRSPLNTRNGAQEYEATLRGRLARGESLQDRIVETSTTFAEFVQRWFETYVRTNNKASTVYTKDRILRHYLVPSFGTKQLRDITGERIESYKARRLDEGLSPKTVNDHLAVLGKCLNSAVEWGALSVRPVVKRLRLPPSRYTFLTAEECQLVLSDQTEPMYNCMVRAALRTGMRPSELTSLTWDAVDLRTDTITVCASRWRDIVDSPKNNRIRHLPIAPDLHDALANQPREGSLVFCNSDGSYVTEAQRDEALRRLYRRLGLRPISWYTFRHTFATQLVAAGVPLPVVKELMGHSTINMTMRYAHVTSASLRDAVTALSGNAAAVSDATHENGQPAVNRRLEPPPPISS